MSTEQENTEFNFNLMCFIDGIAPIGGDFDDFETDQLNYALESSDALAELIHQEGGIRIELDTEKHYLNAKKIMTVIDLLKEHIDLFELSIQDEAAFLVPAKPVESFN